MNVMLVSLYETISFPLRILTPLLNGVDGIKAHSVFFKDKQGNRMRMHTKREESIFVDTLKELKPGIVGFSVYTAFSPIAARLTELVKKNTDAITVWGGVHPTLYPDMCMDKTDAICVGEGEETIVELSKAVSESRPWQDIRNLWVNNGGKIIKNPLRPLYQDIDGLPYPSYGDERLMLIENNKISRRDPLADSPCLWVQAARGCPYKCSFCVNCLLHDKFRGLGTFLRRRSVDSIIGEIKDHFENFGGKETSIFFFDEVFATNSEWLTEFENRYKNEVGLPFVCSLNPLMAKKDILSRLASSGLAEITIGIQSGSDEIRNNIFERPGTGDEIVEVAKQIKSLGVLTVYDLILDNPYENAETLKSTLRLFLRLPKPMSFHMFCLKCFPDYRFTLKALADGVIPPEHATPEFLLNSVTKNWAFFPTLLPYNKKQVMQNIIWLYSRNRCSDETVRDCIDGNSFASSMKLFFTNIKAVILGRMTFHLVYNNRFIGNQVARLKGTAFMAKRLPNRILKKF